MKKKRRLEKYYSLERGGIKANHFIVIEVQSAEVIFSSLSRKKANHFIKHQLNVQGSNWGFGLNMPGKSLDYNFAYAPSEYQSTGLLSLLIAVVGFFLVNEVLGGLLIIVSLFCFVQSFRSRKVFQKLQLSS